MTVNPTHSWNSRSVHRCALALACVTFPLIWVGGLVTTYDAGMAVPDWPGTYGYNMFLYPPEVWITGPWDLFIEHGHRLLGSLAGIIAIALLLVAWRNEQRRWVVGLCVLALVLVIAQGALGGVRVLAADRAIAKIHGCVGPAFFALAACLSVVTSRWWFGVSQRLPQALHPSVWYLSVLVLGLTYLQLVLGANLRHINLETDPMVFRSIALFHVIGAFAAWFHGLLLSWKISQLQLPFDVKWPVGALTGLLSLQIVFGLGTWVVKWGWPLQLSQYTWFSGWVVPAKSMVQANTITVHVATGSLIIALSVMVCLRLARITHFHRLALSPSRAKGVPA